MTQYVICALQMEGFHCWPEADGELAYLKNSHRHIFFITAEFPVHNANREIEIISQQNTGCFPVTSTFSSAARMMISGSRQTM